MYFVTVAQLIEHFKLESFTPNVDHSERSITQCDVNRPALQLAGFFDYFDSTRLQIIGKVEYTYLEKMEEEERNKRIKRLLDYKDIPFLPYL